MPMLSNEERHTFRALLAQMPGPMHLLIFTDRVNPHGAEARQLGQELRALSRNVHLELHDVDTNPLLAARYGIHDTPAIALFTGGIAIEDTRIRCYGVPKGSVLQALVDGMVAVSCGRPAIAGPNDLRVQRLDRAVRLDVFVPSPEPADPQTLLHLQRLALLGPQLSTAIVLAADFPEWARLYASDETMTIVVNDHVVLRATASEQQLLDALETAARGEPEPLGQERAVRSPGAGGEIDRAARSRRPSDGASARRAGPGAAVLSWPLMPTSCSGRR